jgi:hypothetical protein
MNINLKNTKTSYNVTTPQNVSQEAFIYFFVLHKNFRLFTLPAVKHGEVSGHFSYIEKNNYFCPPVSYLNLQNNIFIYL